MRKRNSLCDSFAMSGTLDLMDAVDGFLYLAVFLNVFPLLI